MREIKFRGWDVNKKQMYPIDAFTCNWNKNILTGISKLKIKKGNVLMQYTGLKDKNGKEIYEGDIVLVKEIESFGIDEFIAVVEYDNKNACFVMNENGAKHPFWNIDYVYIKVLGNIYENPELLEEK